MMTLNGKKYVQGTLDISRAALARLAEMGVKPPFNRYPQGGTFDSFYLPEGESGDEFYHDPGNPGCEGRLRLKSELK